MSQFWFSCYQCINDQCKLPDNKLTICKTAFNCWKSSLREIGNKIQHSRGCISTLHQSQDICNNITQASHYEYGYNCCQEELCNGGDFPELLRYRYADKYLFWLFFIFNGILIALGVAVAFYFNVVLRIRRRGGLQQRPPNVKLSNNQSLTSDLNLAFTIIFNIYRLIDNPTSTA